MTEQEFKDQFVCTFLSGWASVNYDFLCMNGKQYQLSHPPVEDAIFLAKESWREYQEKKDI